MIPVRCTSAPSTGRKPCTIPPFVEDISRQLHILDFPISGQVCIGIGGSMVVLHIEGRWFGLRWEGHLVCLDINGLMTWNNTWDKTTILPELGNRKWNYFYGKPCPKTLTHLHPPLHHRLCHTWDINWADALNFYPSPTPSHLTYANNTLLLITQSLAPFPTLPTLWALCRRMKRLLLNNH